MSEKSSGLGVKLLKVLVLVILLLVAVFVAGGLFLPKDFDHRASQDIKADRARIHALVGDLRAWNEWGPWVEEDPTIKSTYSERTDEAGAWHEWTGENPKKGKIVLLSTSPEKGVAYQITFDDMPPFEGAISYADAADGATKVTWSMTGTDDSMIGRWFHKIGSGMMQSMFMKGLDKMKSKAEAAPST